MNIYIYIYSWNVIKLIYIYVSVFLLQHLCACVYIYEAMIKPILFFLCIEVANFDIGEICTISFIMNLTLIKSYIDQFFLLSKSNYKPIHINSDYPQPFP